MTEKNRSVENSGSEFVKDFTGHIKIWFLENNVHNIEHCIANFWLFCFISFVVVKHLYTFQNYDFNIRSNLLELLNLLW